MERDPPLLNHHPAEFRGGEEEYWEPNSRGGLLPGGGIEENQWWVTFYSAPLTLSYWLHLCSALRNILWVSRPSLLRLCSQLPIRAMIVWSREPGKLMCIYAVCGHGWFYLWHDCQTPWYLLSVHICFFIFKLLQQAGRGFWTSFSFFFSVFIIKVFIETGIYIDDDKND